MKQSKSLNFLKLGILYYDNTVVNHRSLSKVILNPILRYFGWYIGSVFDKGVFVRYSIGRCPPSSKIIYTLETNDYNRIVLKNIF